MMNTLETMPSVEFGPLQESAHITSGIDFYKPTMSQVAFEQEPDAEVTFTFHNRGEQRIADYVDAEQLQAKLDWRREFGFDQSELDYFAGLKLADGRPTFSDAFIDYLSLNQLPKVEVSYDPEIDDLAIETTGPWSMVTFWETVVMSEVNEAYFEGYIRQNNIDVFELYDEGERRLQAKIDILKEHPDIKFSDFGTRRHFSLRWHKYVTERLVAECPDNFLGTSNIEIANRLNVKPIGTFAHEMFMTFAGLADARGEDVRASHGKLLDIWYDTYGEDLAIALTDTFGSDFFLSDFTPEQATKWRSLRHDSGDPYDFAEKVIGFYGDLDIDPLTKTIVFSDGLDIEAIVALNEKFKGRINIVFGWGTTLTNDLGVDPLNIVMKPTHGLDTITGEQADFVKLSDNKGKHLGAEELITRYQNIFRVLDLERHYYEKV